MKQKYNYKKTFVDSCLFIEIILEQPKREDAEKILNYYKEISSLYINPKIITEVIKKIEEEIEENFKRTYIKIEEKKIQERNRMRKDFYNKFEELLSFCRLSIPNKSYKDFSNLNKTLSKIRFNTAKKDYDIYHLSTAISRKMNFFITFDNGIIKDKNKIKGISKGELEVCSF